MEAIGLDVGSSAVRAVQLEQTRGGRLRLARYGEVTLPHGAVVAGDVVEPAAVVDALQELWGRARLRGRRVAVGIASQRVTVRQLELPELPDDELRDAVRLQAADHLPMPIEEALIDHVVIDRPGADGERRTVRLLLVAAEQEMVDRLLTAVTGAKLRPVLVDLDAFALVRCLADTGAGVGNAAATPGPEGGQVELIVDIGATVAKLVVHRGGGPLFVRMVGLGGHAATRDLQEALDLDWDEAESAKLAASASWAAGVQPDPDDERVRVLRSAAERIVAEVRRSLDYFQSQHAEAVVQRVLLSGGVSLTPTLADRLEAALEVPVEHRGPLRAVAAKRFRNQLDDLDRDAPFLAVAVGLAQGLVR